uniref:Uncharacterized protein n=1 Tax=Arundo donax TaxID=35708 RepID=A0A0A9FTN4_ARUDO
MSKHRDFTDFLGFGRDSLVV